jgi:hypothetical protein
MIMFYGDYPPYQPNVSQCSNRIIQGIFCRGVFARCFPTVTFLVYTRPINYFEMSIINPTMLGSPVGAISMGTIMVTTSIFCGMYIIKILV